MTRTIDISPIKKRHNAFRSYPGGIHVIYSGFNNAYVMLWRTSLILGIKPDWLDVVAELRQLFRSGDYSGEGSMQITYCDAHGSENCDCRA